MKHLILFFLMSAFVAWCAEAHSPRGHCRHHNEKILEMIPHDGTNWSREQVNQMTRYETKYRSCKREHVDYHRRHGAECKESYRDQMNYDRCTHTFSKRERW